MIDYHVFFQQILLISLRHKMFKELKTTIIWICRMFKFICNKVYDLASYPMLKSRTPTTLCHLEKVFPPSFVNLMTHLVIHLVHELEICGPIHAYWMYPIERAMKDFNGYVHNFCHCFLTCTLEFLIILMMPLKLEN
jgi:hypothetical protein